MQQTGKTMADEQAQRKGLGCTDDASAPTLDLGPVSSQGLSYRQAGEVLKLLLIHNGYKPPIYWEEQALRNRKKDNDFKRTGFYLKPFESQPSDYWAFELRYATIGDRYYHFHDDYAVSKLTGDIIPYELHCERYSFPALQRVQKSIMKQTGKTIAGEKAQREKTGLPCPDELLR